MAGKDGLDKLEAMVKSMLEADPPGGTIFIDEAGQLADKRVGGGGGGVAVVQRLIKLSEDHRDVLSFMLSGYEHQFKELLAIDLGLRSRFPRVFVFSDYNEPELAHIFRKMVEDRGKKNKGQNPWNLESNSIADIAARRLARRAKQPGFGNARDVRNLLANAITVQKARWRALSSTGPPDPSQRCVIAVEDVIGKRPNLSTCVAYQQIQKKIGLEGVKREVEALIRRMQQTWDADREGKLTGSPPILSQIFVGNPGMYGVGSIVDIPPLFIRCAQLNNVPICMLIICRLQARARRPSRDCTQRCLRRRAFCPRAHASRSSRRTSSASTRARPCSCPRPSWRAPRATCCSSTRPTGCVSAARPWTR